MLHQRSHRIDGSAVVTAGGGDPRSLDLSTLVVEGSLRVEEEDILATMRLPRGVPCTRTEVSRDARALWELGWFDDIVIATERVGCICPTN